MGDAKLPITSYDDMGRCTGRTSSLASGSLTETRAFNIQGWLTSLSSANAQSNIYSQTLRYYDPQKSGTCALYAGGISEWSSTTLSNAASTYAFTYDASARLTGSVRYTGVSDAGDNSYTERGISYDGAGNVTSLQRYGVSSSSPDNNYAFSYSGSLLTGISGTDHGAAISASFSYDANGNMTHDGRAGVDLTYNILNLTGSASKGGASLSYHFLSDGSKHRTVNQGGAGILYAGPFTFNVSSSGVGALETTVAAGGDALMIGSAGSVTTAYTVRDHLGSVRAVVGRDGTVLESNEYYPFGQRHDLGRNYPTVSSNRLKYNGKEKQDIASLSLPYLDYGARLYNPDILRWTTQDPLQEKYFIMVPYCYCSNDPVNRFDPDGMTDYFDIGGKFFYADNIDNGEIRISTQEAMKTAKSVCGGDIADYMKAFGSMSLTSAVKAGVVSEDNLSKALLNIARHYNETGLGMTTGTLDNGAQLQTNFYEDGSANISIDTKNSWDAGFFENYNNLKNAINGHEGDGHREKEKQIGLSSYSKIPGPQRELDAIAAQRMHPSWSKTTESFQEGVQNYEDRNRRLLQQ